ncbi:hypothetical protein [Kingella oralis]|uniref:hypothetical protein n=1 Tax=Kingella oralis TaxID=505 RepID=UPI0034E50875
MGLHGYTWFQAALSCLQYRGSLKTDYAMERRRFIAKWLASKGSLKMGLCSGKPFQAASSYLQPKAA